MCHCKWDHNSKLRQGGDIVVVSLWCASYQLTWILRAQRLRKLRERSTNVRSTFESFQEYCIDPPYSQEGGENLLLLQQQQQNANFLVKIPHFSHCSSSLLKLLQVSRKLCMHNHATFCWSAAINLWQNFVEFLNFLTRLPPFHPLNSCYSRMTNQTSSIMQKKGGARGFRVFSHLGESAAKRLMQKRSWPWMLPAFSSSFVHAFFCMTFRATTIKAFIIFGIMKSCLTGFLGPWISYFSTKLHEAPRVVR